MKTVQFNANQILNGNHYPIASNMVIISTGHDDSIIDDSMDYVNNTFIITNIYSC